MNGKSLFLRSRSGDSFINQGLISAPSMQIEANSLYLNNSIFNASYNFSRFSPNMIIYTNTSFNSTNNMQIFGDKIMILSDGSMSLDSKFSINAKQDLLISSKRHMNLRNGNIQSMVSARFDSSNIN
jgi:hypothetical protein